MNDTPREEGAATADAGGTAPNGPIVRPPREEPSDIAAIQQDEPGEDVDPRRAFEILEIRTPLEELEAYGRARIDTLTRLGETKKAELTAEALDLGRRALARVTGIPLAPPAAEKAR